jgi:hypothetical protein
VARPLVLLRSSIFLSVIVVVFVVVNHSIG